MNINAYVNGLNFQNQLHLVNKLLENAEVEISPWGAEILKAPAYQGTVKIEDIARRVHEVAMLKTRLTFEQREEGLKAVDRLKHIYNHLDEQARTTNFFSSILNSTGQFFRDLTLQSGYLNIKVGITERHFKSYSTDEFLLTFGGESEDENGYYVLHQHPNYNGKIEKVGHVIAKDIYYLPSDLNNINQQFK